MFPYLGGCQIGAEEIAAATEVLKRQTLFRFYGPEEPREVAILEELLCRYFDRPYCLAVTSGTAALHTVLSGLRFPMGSEILIPAYAWISVPLAVLAAGYAPVIVDIDESLSISTKEIEKAITSKTKGIIAVHMDGAAAPADRIRTLCDSRNITLIEDCAQGMGTTLYGKPVGTWGAATTLSFQYNKVMTAGEGGALLFSDSELWERCIRFHDVGLLRTTGARFGIDEGYTEGLALNYRLSELTAAVLRVQLHKVGNIIDGMRQKQRFLKNLLKSFTSFSLVHGLDAAGENGNAVRLLFKDSKRAKAISCTLREQGIPAYTLSESGAHIYQKWSALPKKKALPKTDALLESALRIPIWPTMTETLLEKIAALIRQNISGEKI